MASTLAWYQWHYVGMNSTFRIYEYNKIIIYEMLNCIILELKLRYMQIAN